MESKYNPDIHHRRSIRLRDYDYSLAGAYFVTMVAQDRALLFGEVVDGAMVLNDAGRMIAEAWLALPARFPNIELDVFVVMPNHVHGIIVIAGSADVDGTDSGPGQRAGTRPAPTDNDAVSVGATLVVARLTNDDPPDERPPDDDPPRHDSVGQRAGTRPAPTDDDAVSVGATLVVARLTNDDPPDERPLDERLPDDDPPRHDSVGQRAGTRPAPTDGVKSKRPSLGDVVGAYKSLTTHAYIQGVHDQNWPSFRGRVWQRNYYEHIIRNDESLQRIRYYIEANSEWWLEDRENPAAAAFL